MTARRGGSMAPGSGDRRELSRAEVARAVPRGSRQIRSQREALRRGLACPDLAGVRADFREHLRDWWKIHVCHASWGGEGRPPPGTTEPTRARVCALAGMSPSTHKACRRWWEARGYIAIVRPGSTPDLCAAVLSSTADGNVRQAYVLCVPRRPGTARTEPRPVSRPLSKSRRDLDKLPARETRGPENTKPGRTGAPRSPALRGGTLRGLTDGWWAHITAPFATWSASDLVWAVDHLPGGRQHRTRAANVRHPAGWLRWRLSHWLNADGTAMPSPSQQRAATAERHRVYLRRRDHELGLTARAANIRAMGGYETAAPAPQHAWQAPHRTSRTEARLAGWAARHSVAVVTLPAPSGLPVWWTAAIAAAARAIAAKADVGEAHGWNGDGGKTQMWAATELAADTSPAVAKEPACEDKATSARIAMRPYRLQLFAVTEDHELRRYHNCAMFRRGRRRTFTR
jgi:hypothetical protein